MRSDPADLIRRGAIISLVGFILSGPVAVALVMYFTPQPTWSGVEAFRSHYDPLQTLPYFFGFILLTGILMMMTGLLQQSSGSQDEVKMQIRIAHALTLVFISLIALNYIGQTTFVPHLLSMHSPDADTLISGFSMSNPNSLGWALEMWGYGILGIALWLLAGYYHDALVVRVMLLLNALVSIGSLVWAIFNATWVETTLGLILYFLWNALMMMILVLIIQKSRA
ncbi:MAG TPA: hypothetical protein VJ508_03800 [Saprospiraceae bacterium]|nr:hypothetical protein [Saprospiraceae bacterium]